MKKCDRCGGDASTWQMSRFNKDECCGKCITREKKHPKYPEACAAELAECNKGNYNFDGIGLPRDLAIEHLVILSPQWTMFVPNEGTVFLGHVQGVDHFFSNRERKVFQVTKPKVEELPLVILQCEPLDKKSDTRILMEMCGLW